MGEAHATLVADFMMRCFSEEGLERRMHNQELSSLTDFEDLCHRSEDLVVHLVDKVNALRVD